MIDLKRLAEAGYREGIAKKGCPPEVVEAALAADAECRALRAQTEELRARQNAASRQIGAAAPDERPALIAAAAGLREALDELGGRLASAEDHLDEVVGRIPNPAHPSVPAGGEDEGQVLRVVGAAGPAPSLDHAELGEALGLVDVERAVRLSGSRFAYLMREAVMLELALVRWVMGRLVDEGFVPVVPPVLVRGETMEAAGFFPTERAQVYGVGSASEGSLAELYLVGTAEVPLAGLHFDEILAEGDLPARYGGFSTCFRREAGTYGRDTRGLFRVHQFDKVEMFSYAHPERSDAEHEALLGLEESILTDLGLPYRVVTMAAGDLAPPAARKYDLEVWLPSEGRYREATSCSNYTDFAARRARTRYRPSSGGTRLVHTLNGTACAVGRTLLFIFEHWQDAKGALVVPPVLAPLCGFDRVPPAGGGDDREAAGSGAGSEP
ncbi:MAG: serine--tRNA ligase [Acidimicrobiales bacterium]